MVKITDNQHENQQPRQEERIRTSASSNAKTRSICYRGWHYCAVVILIGFVFYCAWELLYAFSCVCRGQHFRRDLVARRTVFGFKLLGIGLDPNSTSVEGSNLSAHVHAPAWAFVSFSCLVVVALSANKCGTSGMRNIVCHRHCCDKRLRHIAHQSSIQKGKTSRNDHCRMLWTRRCAAGY